MSLSLEYLERCSAESGFRIAPLEKVARLGEMASDVARHPLLGTALALKGGTALNLCFGAPRRLSVDLDYNYTGQRERGKMLEDRPRVEAAVRDLADRRGFRVQESADSFAGRKLFLRFRSVLGHDDRIEVDLNFLFRVPLVETETRFLWQPGALDQAHVRVVGLAELIVGKLLALLDRGAPRDVWDVAEFPGYAAEMLASASLRARFVALSAVLEHPLTTYKRDRLERRLTDRAMAEHLVPMLAASATSGVHGLFSRAWAVVEPLLALRPHETAYTNAIDRGELRLELLFPDDPAEAARLTGHPAIHWKLANVRAHRSRSPRDSKGPAPVNDPDESRST